MLKPWISTAAVLIAVSVLVFTSSSRKAVTQDIKLLNVSYDPTRELYEDINPAFIAAYNDRCRPFAWTKTADEIIPRATRQPTSDARH